MRCTACGGKGKKLVAIGFVADWVTCKKCGGTGQVPSPGSGGTTHHHHYYR